MFEKQTPYHTLTSVPLQSPEPHIHTLTRKLRYTHLHTNTHIHTSTHDPITTLIHLSLTNIKGRDSFQQVTWRVPSAPCNTRCTMGGNDRSVQKVTQWFPFSFHFSRRIMTVSCSFRFEYSAVLYSQPPAFCYHLKNMHLKRSTTGVNAQIEHLLKLKDSNFVCTTVFCFNCRKFHVLVE